MNRYLLKAEVKKRLARLVRKQDIGGFSEALEHPESFLNNPNASEEDYRIVQETARELAERWGLYGKLFRVGSFRGWDEENSAIDLEAEKIYNPEVYAELTPEGLKGRMLGWSELDPQLKIWGLSDEVKEKLSGIYKKVQAGEIPLEDYIKELQPFLWDDFDPEGVKLIRNGREYHAVYPFVYDLEDGNPPLPVPRVMAVIDGKVQIPEGRNALKYIEKNSVAPEELLKEVVRWADQLHYADLEVEEVWKRIEEEASPEVRELLKEIEREYVEPENLSWAEVSEIYNGGFFSYLYEGYSSTNINGSGYIAPERIGYWYLRPDGTIDYLEVSSELVGTESEWTPESLMEAYEKITETVKNAHPLSGMALYESAVENWIKEELRPYLEEKVKETVRSLGVFPERKEEALKLAGRIKEELQKEGIPPSLLEDLIGDEGIAEVVVDVEPEPDEELNGEDNDFSP